MTDILGATGRCILFGGLFLAIAVPAQAAKFKVVYVFQGGNDAASPIGAYIHIAANKQIEAAMTRREFWLTSSIRQDATAQVYDNRRPSACSKNRRESLFRRRRSARHTGAGASALKSETIFDFGICSCGQG